MFNKERREECNNRIRRANGGDAATNAPSPPASPDLEQQNPNGGLSSAQQPNPALVPNPTKPDAGTPAPQYPQNPVRPYKDGGKAKWMQGAVKHPGALHEELGVPEGKRIPAKKLEKATHSRDPQLKRRAVLAETFRKFNRHK